MSEISEQSKNKTTPPPAPPEHITDPEQIAGGEERWQACPLKDCKRDVELLYEDFYLRGMRSDRLMCSKCAVRVEIGYMAREEVKKSDDRFFEGTNADNLIVMGIMLAGSVVVNALMFVIGFWFLGLFIGFAVGSALATFARRRAGGRVTRQMPYYAIAGVVLGALLAPTVYFLLTFGVLVFSPIFNLSIILASGATAFSAWGVFMRRI